MEEIFCRILKDTSPTKYPQVHKTCWEAQDKCLSALQEALESKNSKLVSHAIKGFEEIVRDKSFQASFETEDEEKWLPSQLVKAVQSVSLLQDETQLEILKILLKMAYTSGWYLSTLGVLQLLQLYCDVYINGSVQVKTAALATASQTLQAFCNFLQDVDSVDQANNSDDSDTENMNVSDVMDDILPVLKFLCDKLKQSLNQEKIVAPLLLQCFLCVLSNLKPDVRNKKAFVNFVWQEFCPLLIVILGSPKTDKKNITSQTNTTGDNKGEMGRGSGCLNAAPSCLSTNAKTIYSLSAELVRLFGSVGSFRAVLASLFHRMLLYPPAQHRLEGLKALKELLKKPDLVVQLAAPPLYDLNNKNTRASDLDLLKIIIDSLSQCSKSQDSAVCCGSVSCILALLNSLEQIMEGKGLSEAHVTHINKIYKFLEDAEIIKQTSSKITEKLVTKEEMDNDSLEDSSKITPEINNATENETQQVFFEGDSLSIQDNFSDIDDDASDSLEKKYSDPGVENENKINEENRNNITCSSEEKFESCEEEIDGVEGREEEKKSEKEAMSVKKDENETVKDDDPPSISSGTTEGPEDQDEIDFDQLDKDTEEEEKLKELEETARREKAPRTLLGQEDHGKEERERVERLCEAYDEFAQLERQNAQHFLEVLIDLLPSVLVVKSSIEADQALQEFASKYCEGMWKKQDLQRPKNEENNLRPVTIVNADGIYLATYSTLLLNLKLIKSAYYDGKCLKTLMTENEFIEEVHGSGVLVYLSATWLSEVYQQVMAKNVLQLAGYNPVDNRNHSLINLLVDLDGLGSTEQGGQLLSDYKRLERAVSNIHSTPAREAGLKFARLVLTSSWDVILNIPSVLLNGTNECGITDNLGLILGTENAKEENRRVKEAVAESLDALQIAAKLCNLLGLQSSCGAVFAQLAIASCPVNQDPNMSPSKDSILSKKRQKLRLKKSTLTTWTKTLRLHPSHILSLDVILKKGLELGSHSPHCWKHVFRTSLYVMGLEHSFFSVHGKPPLVPVSASANRKAAKSQKNDPNGFYLPPFPSSDVEDGPPLDLSFIPGRGNPQTVDIGNLLKKTNENGGVLKDKQLQPIVEALSQLVDILFEEASNQLNLSSLITFLAELCGASQEQLFAQNSTYGKMGNIGNLQQSHARTLQTNSLLMNRLADVMLHCARGGRPLIHVMKAWSVVAPHFVEAACHKEQDISKQAVTSIHDIVSALLSSHPELPHFHFNEALFKPFENLLCLELCDLDVQEQIISSICEFVESCTTDVRSGWRPLFGALRAVRLSDPSQMKGKSLVSIDTDREQARYLRVVLDVFNAFLGTENILVFANAAVDCLLCLLKHVRGPTELQDNQNLVPNDQMGINEPWPLDLCLAALKYLERCSGILSFMFKMPACPVLNSAHRIQVHREPILVDSNIQNGEILAFDCEESHYPKDSSNDLSQTNSPSLQPAVTLESLDPPTGILHVWFLLLEGLVGAVSTCPRKYQPHTMETLFSLLNSLKSTPGPDFGIICINHLLLPMLQNWLRRTARIYRGWDNYATNFKQCCGLTTDLIVDYLIYLSENGILNETKGANLMFHQLLLVLTECVAQAVESVSRLGCACIKHVLTSAGHVLTPDLWEIACSCLVRASRVSLRSVQQLMACFRTDSENVYGDVGQVKVAARKDCSPQEFERLHQLAQQVLLLDCQSSNSWAEKKNTACGDKSFVFLLHPPGIEDTSNPELFIIRVPFRSVVVGLVSHQVLLQTLATVLLQGTRYMLPSLSSLLSNTIPLSSPLHGENQSQATPLPGFLARFNSRNLQRVLACLSESYKTARDFDARPGLKFLMQKVAQSDVAANLYKQAGISWTIQALVLFELCLHHEELNLDFVNEQLSAGPLPPPTKDSNNSDDEDECDSRDSLEEGEKDSNESDAIINDTTKSRKETNCFRRLRTLFTELCDTYADVILDKEGASIVDKIRDEPIFFLTLQPDEYAEYRKSSVSSGSLKSQEDEMKDISALRRSSVDSSDSDSPQIDDGTDRVYAVATEKTINNVVSEYKKRKSRHSLPSSFKERSTKKSSSESSSQHSYIPEEVEKQRRNSILRDSEARQQVWTQLLQSVLDLHLSLPDSSFHAMLPVIFPGVQILVVYSVDNGLRTTIADWMGRVAACCGFGAFNPLTQEV